MREVRYLPKVGPRVSKPWVWGSVLCDLRALTLTQCAPGPPTMSCHRSVTCPAFVSCDLRPPTCTGSPEAQGPPLVSLTKGGALVVQGLRTQLPGLVR